MLGKIGMQCAFAAALVLGMASGAFAADDGVWSVSKSSGEVWLATSGAQPVSLNQDGTLKPGDTIRTGRNGRVLLVRGEETILISPNSVVGLPAEKKEGLSTTIIQQAGSILLEVEKRNVKHFEVETPYLAAVVKGTQFSVTVGAGSTKVGVVRGQVEVSDFKTGQIAQVMPGQSATVFEHGKPGLSLSGAGTFNPIEQGKPRASTIERIPVPKSGLSAPRNAASGHAIHALGPIDKGAKGTKAAGAPKPSHQASGAHAPKAGVVRISGSLGEVKLNFHKVTHGLARGAAAPGQVRNANASSSTETVWSDTKTSTTTTAANSSSVTAVTTSSSASAASATSSSSSATTTVATSAGSTSDASGNNGNNSNGNSGNNGNGNGSGNGNGNSGATGNGKGNNDNGNGNGGGNGSNGHGHGRH